MRILFLTDRESPDYGEGMLWQGLRDTIGAENLFDYPIKPSFHDGYMEQVPYGPFGWFGKGTPLAWKVVPKPEEYKEFENHVLDGIESALKSKRFDAIVAGSMRGEPIEFLKTHGIYDIANHEGIPVAIYDAWDNQSIHEYMLPFCDYYLKREMAVDSDNPKILHYPFGIPDAVLKTPKEWSLDRTKAEIDVLFIMGNSHPKRTQMYYAIKEWMCSGKAKLRWEAYLTGSVDQAVDYEKYLSLLDNSKYAISLVGGGEDTVRFWEILGRTGLIHDYPKLQCAQEKRNFFGIGFNQEYEMTPEAIEKQILNYHVNCEAFVAEGFRGAFHHTCSARARSLVATLTGEYL